MNELLSYEQVKKVYRKAVLHIHPDKVIENQFFQF
jgi:curved DNA-binding protein CbpA